MSFSPAPPSCRPLLVAINVYEHRRRALVRLKKLSYYAPTGRVRVLSPCKGHDAHLEENLRALLTQDYPDYEVTFIVEDAGDPACPVIRRAMAACPQTPARLLVAGRAEGCGQKVHNLRMATADLSPEIRHLAFFDSDSRPKPYWVRAAIYKHYLPQIGATTGYRWLIPQRPTVANHLVAAINCNVMAVLGRDSHHIRLGRILGDSPRDVRAAGDPRGLGWNAQRRPGGLEPVAPRRIGGPLRSGLRADLAGRFRLVRHVRFRAAAVPHYAALCLPLVAAGLGRGDGRQPGVDRLARAAGLARCSAERSRAWLPATVLAVLYGLGLYRGWAMQSLAAVYSPENLPELRGVRRWHVWASPAVAFVQWLGLIASAFGNRVKWRAIDYRLGADGRVISSGFSPAARRGVETESAEFDRKNSSRNYEFGT